MNAEQRRHLEDLLQTYQRRLRALEKQKAIFGPRTPPEVDIEIEDTQAEIAHIESQLSAPPPSPKSPNSTDNHEAVGKTPQAYFNPEMQTSSARGNTTYHAPDPASWRNKQKRVTSVSPLHLLVTVLITAFVLFFIWNIFNGARLATTSLTGKIAFVSDRSGHWEIYVTSVDGNTQAKIGNLQVADASSPSWSRDAAQIAFTAKDEAGYDQIYVMNADGSRMFRLTNVTGDAGVPTWSPNGKQIAFQVRDKNSGLFIVVMNLNDKQQFPLTHNLTEDKYPAWSPDGKKIAFESYRDGNWELYVMNADGSDQAQRLTNTSVDEHGPAWSPDGQKIVYILEQNGQRDIYSMNADGSDSINITHAALPNPGVPSWSPDGQYIVFQAESDNKWQLFVMKADGSDRHQLTFRERDGVNYFPSWSPAR
jgi:Tol biopolymer transport system component